MESQWTFVAEGEDQNEAMKRFCDWRARHPTINERLECEPEAIRIDHIRTAKENGYGCMVRIGVRLKEGETLEQDRMEAG